MAGLIISGIMSICSGILLYILKDVLQENKKLKKEKTEADRKKELAMENGLKCMLRDKLIDKHCQYAKRNNITLCEYDNWTQMYDAYHDLGGNGVIEHLREEIEELRMKS